MEKWCNHTWPTIAQNRSLYPLDWYQSLSFSRWQIVQCPHCARRPLYQFSSPPLYPSDLWCVADTQSTFYGSFRWSPRNFHKWGRGNPKLLLWLFPLGEERKIFLVHRRFLIKPEGFFCWNFRAKEKDFWCTNF